MRIFYLLVLLCSAHLLTGQIISSMSVSEDTINIGDKIEVYYKLSAPKTTAIKGINFSSLDSLDSLVPTSSADTSSMPYYAEVEWAATFMNYEKKLVPFHLVSKTEIGNKYVYKDTFEATFWDLGFYEFLHPTVVLDSSSINEKLMRLEAPTVFVSAPVLKNPDTTSVILPIKDIIESEKSWKDYIKSILYILLPLLIIGGLLYFYFFRKKTEEEVIYVAPPKEAAHVIALRKLETLAKNQDWNKGKVKKYQSDLTYTIREYLENRYEIKALESTTDEIARALAKNNFSPEHETDLKEILQIADLVKFAKAQPSEDLNETFLHKAKQFVLETKQVINLTDETGDVG